jgi:uncharacterized membrane protein YqhA
MSVHSPDHRRRPSELIAQMVASSRFFVLLATVSLFLAFMAVMVSTMVKTVTTIYHSVIHPQLNQNEMVGQLIKQADYALLATVLYVLALGLYSLFVDDRVPMPGWLRISDLGNLKVAIAVIFLGQALTWDGKTDLLAPGLASAAVIAALALFLWQAARERQLDRQAGPPGRAAGDHEGDADGHGDDAGDA